MAGEYAPDLEESIRRYIFEHNGLKLETSVTDEGDQSIISKKKHSKNVGSVDKVSSTSASKKTRASAIEDIRTPTSSMRKDKKSSKTNIVNKSVDLRDIRAKSPTPEYSSKASSRILPDDIEVQFYGNY